VSERVNGVLRLVGDVITCHYDGESFEAISCAAANTNTQRNAKSEP